MNICLTQQEYDALIRVVKIYLGGADRQCRPSHEEVGLETCLEKLCLFRKETENE